MVGGQGGDKAYNFIVLDHPEMEAYDVVIIGPIVICDRMLSVLFDFDFFFSSVCEIFFWLVLEL